MRNKAIMQERISPMGWIMGFLVFSLIPAFYVWNSPLDTIFTFAVSAIVMVDIIQHKDRMDKYRKLGIFLYVFIFLIFIIRSDFTVLGVIKKLFVIPLLFSRRALLKESFNAFVWVYAGVMTISLVVYILVIFAGIGFPYKVIDPLNELKNYTYYLYPFLITSDSIDTLGLSFRFCGLFDEPGVVGTFSAIILIINRFDFKRIYNIIAFIAGVFSFSLFFYVICTVAVFLSAPGKVKIGTVLLIAVVLYVFKDNEIVNQLVFSRFSDESALGIVDNRNTGYFVDVYEKFSKTPAFWTGMGAGKAEVLGEGGSSYKMLVYDYGMVFFFFYVLCFYFFAIGIIRGGRQYLAFSMILLGTMYQRPFLGGVSFTFIMLAAPHLIVECYSGKERAIKNNTKDKQNKVQYVKGTTNR